MSLIVMKKEEPEDVNNETPLKKPQAVIEYYSQKPNAPNLSELRSHARRHLLSLGWYFWKGWKGCRQELRYTSPSEKIYYSLRMACKGCIQETEASPSQGSTLQKPKKKRREDRSDESNSDTSLDTSISQKRKKLSRKEDISEDSTSNFQLSPLIHRHLADEELEMPLSQLFPLSSSHKLNKRRRKKLPKRDDIFNDDNNPKFQPLPQCDLTCKESKISVSRPSPLLSLQKRKNKKRRREDDSSDDSDSVSCGDVISNERAREVVESNPKSYTRLTILSWLIANYVVLPREEVYCKSRTNGVILAQGRIACDGIKCNCCSEVFGMTQFKDHAGVSHQRPTACIFLEDGRSLLDCEKDMAEESKLKYLTFKRIKTKSGYVNDEICSICQCGGFIVMCDQCSSSFHLNCMGLDSEPEGDWFCPSCRCGVCGRSNFNEENFREKPVLYCDQCEREFHVRCVGNLESCPSGKWFCSEVCMKIFTSLHELIGKSVEVGGNKLSWTLLKYWKDGGNNDAFDVEIQSKLSLALALMHECFDPIKESKKKYLVEDVLFNKPSALRRLHFRGFYTAILEREDELISVATFRVFGGKLAEVPLVATRFQYRQQGMCHTLMNMLEKKLGEIGVEKLLLPAIPQMLQAWTGSFGFTEMTKSERLEYLQYIFLDFRDTKNVGNDFAP